MNISQNIKQIKVTLPLEVTLVAVSKTKSEKDILEAYQTGQRVFGENKIQEMTDKYHTLPKDISWHMIGHVQSNKVKYMAPYVSLIHGVDSLKLLKEINKQAIKNDRIINCLLQIHIAKEETKFGLNQIELNKLLASEEFENLKNICIRGLMGMATYTENTNLIESEFLTLRKIYDDLLQKPQTINLQPQILSMGMSNDYEIAIKNGSNMVRIGSSIFGERN